MSAGRRFLAIFLPELSNELASEQASHPDVQRARSQPSAVVLTSSAEQAWDSSTRLDAVNAAARERGVRARQTIAEASALVANLKVLFLQRARICAALKQIAEVALAYGSPVSFDEADTVWVEISGSSHLFGTEQQLAAQLVSSVRALGHVARIATADGPWVARALARHAAFDESPILVLPSNETARAVATLPILALPVDSETIAWLARLGLLFISDLRSLPSAALAARLPSSPQPALESLARAPQPALGSSARAPQPALGSSARAPQPAPKGRGDSTYELRGAGGIELGSVFDLIRGADDSVLIPYQPEETPLEETLWDDPLNDVEPLLFVLKGLASRLASRLEGRGQAAQELLLTIQHDRSMAALESAATGREVAASRDVHFRLATPLVHAEDIERVVRARLQREVLAAPAVGLCLRATAVTVAQSWQLGLCPALGLGADVVPEARSMAVLVAELSGDVGSDAVGVLATDDSHLIEKSSRLTPIGSIEASSDAAARPSAAPADGYAGVELSSLRLPTRLLADPLELTAGVEPEELWVLGEQPYVVKEIRFEERLEAVEWWENEPVSRDYFRVWLTAIERNQRADGGIEVLAYFDRENGKSFVQAVYD